MECALQQELGGFSVNSNHGNLLLNGLYLINQVVGFALPGHGFIHFPVIQFDVFAFKPLEFLVKIPVFDRKLPDISEASCLGVGLHAAQVEFSFISFEDYSLFGNLGQVACPAASAVGPVAYPDIHTTSCYEE